jgi:hypothetical protein
MQVLVWTLEPVSSLCCLQFLKSSLYKQSQEQRFVQLRRNQSDQTALNGGRFIRFPTDFERVPLKFVRLTGVEAEILLTGSTGFLVVKRESGESGESGQNGPLGGVMQVWSSTAMFKSSDNSIFRPFLGFLLVNISAPNVRLSTFVLLRRFRVSRMW